MEKKFSVLHIDSGATLYTIARGGLTAVVSDLGATLVRLMVPDASGQEADVVLGYDTAGEYLAGTAFLGATVGRNANRIAGASFPLGKTLCALAANEGRNNLHSGPDCYSNRLWQLASHTEDALTLSLTSPDGDQGFPGTARISVTYRLDPDGGLHIVYDGLCDRDTVFNLTNHSYWNLAGHQHPGKAADQLLSLPGRHFCPDDAQNIPPVRSGAWKALPWTSGFPSPSAGIWPWTTSRCICRVASITTGRSSATPAPPSPIRNPAAPWRSTPTARASSSTPETSWTPRARTGSTTASTPASLWKPSSIPTPSTTPTGPSPL